MTGSSQPAGRVRLRGQLCRRCLRHDPPSCTSVTGRETPGTTPSCPAAAYPARTPASPRPPLARRLAESCCDVRERVETAAVCSTPPSPGTSDVSTAEVSWGRQTRAPASSPTTSITTCGTSSTSWTVSTQAPCPGRTSRLSVRSSTSSRTRGRGRVRLVDCSGFPPTSPGPAPRPRPSSWTRSARPK